MVDGKGRSALTLGDEMIQFSPIGRPEALDEHRYLDAVVPHLKMSLFHPAAAFVGLQFDAQRICNTLECLAINIISFRFFWPEYYT